MNKLLYVISLFRPKADENCAVLGYCTAYSGNFVLTFEDMQCSPNFNDQQFLILEDGSDRLSRNVGMDYHNFLRNSLQERSTQHSTPEYLNFSGALEVANLVAYSYRGQQKNNV
jgi:hypothetical protein